MVVCDDDLAFFDMDPVKHVRVPPNIESRKFHQYIQSVVRYSTSARKHTHTVYVYVHNANT